MECADHKKARGQQGPVPFAFLPVIYCPSPGLPSSPHPTDQDRKWDVLWLRPPRAALSLPPLQTRVGERVWEWGWGLGRAVLFPGWGKNHSHKGIHPPSAVARSLLRLREAGRLAQGEPALPVTHSPAHGGPLWAKKIEEAASKNDNPDKEGEGGKVERRKGYWEGRESGRNDGLLFNSSFDVLGTKCINPFNSNSSVKLLPLLSPFDR